MPARTRPFRVLFLEFNEISWELMEPWLEAGALPSFRRLREEGAWARTVCDETGELLDPWVTWTTLHTGVPQSEHGVAYLEQPPETVRAPRTWEIASAAGRKVGVFGSPGSWPPRDVGGFFVPGAFSPDARTWPERLRSIQELNVGQTRAHSPLAPPTRAREAFLLALRLVPHGLGPRTGAEIAATLAEIALHPERSWKKVCVQPVVNFSFFRRLWARTKPDYATFHTNHVAHYQHRFMRALHPERFPDPTDPREIERFGGAIEHGYRVADRLLGRFLDLARRERDVVLCLASSMGQQPWLPARHDGVAPESCRLRSIERLLEILEVREACAPFSTMAPQWNLRIPELGPRLRVARDLAEAVYEPLGQSMFSVREAGDTLVLTPIKRHGLGAGTVCRFPTLPGAPGFPFDELLVRAEATRKSGCHHPVGLLALHGAPVRKGFQVEGTVHIMDVAPTMLRLLGIDVPERMKGRVLDEMFTVPPRRSAGGARAEEA